MNNKFTALKSEWRDEDDIMVVEAMKKLMSVRAHIADDYMCKRRTSVKEGLKDSEIEEYDQAHEKISAMIENLDEIMGLLNFLERQPSVASLVFYLLTDEGAT